MTAASVGVDDKREWCRHSLAVFEASRIASQLSLSDAGSREPRFVDKPEPESESVVIEQLYWSF